MKRSKNAFLSFFLLITATALFADVNDEALILKGKQIYLNQCARCHGSEGKGDGMDAKRLTVTPRNLTEGIYKFQSTKAGSPPSDADLMWTLNHGMSGAGMPSFSNLNKDTKLALIAYVKSLSPIFTSPVESLPAPDTKSRVDLKKGKEVYDKLQCALCHGNGGRANGSSAASLKDSWQKPLPPANLTQGWTYRAGDSATQIYYRLMAGINGAPMPSYAEAVTSPDEAWQLANYVQSLQENTNWDPKVNVHAMIGEVPSINNSVWSQAKKTYVNLQGITYENQKKVNLLINSIYVQAVRTKSGVTFRLQWNDSTNNSSAPSDSLLLALRTDRFDGKGSDNLHNLYAKDVQLANTYSWIASKPNVVENKMGTQVKTISAESSYVDGLYTLLFTCSNELEAGETLFTQNNLYVGFSAWDGVNGDAPLKRAASQWVELPLNSNSTNHH